jgi:D-glycero-alpha-D-manno-heptose-7-phosphate kinase
MIYRSKAPLRIGLAGGGTDVSPFSDEYGGAILNATINLYAYSSITPRTDQQVIFNAIDQNTCVQLNATTQLEIDGVLNLQKGVYNRIVKQFNNNQPLPLELTTYIDAPAGSGLGTSSTLVVSMIGAYCEWLKLPLGEYDIAQLAFDIEREDLKMAGGKQDQYAAAFGGFNFMEFSENKKVIVNPLRIKETVVQELEFHLLLYYTQTSRDSHLIIENQQKNVISKNTDAVEAMLELKKQAFQMKEALLVGSHHKIGEILNYGWQNKKSMATGISNSMIDQTYEAAINAGASGGKISGAGGGGFMIFYCPKNTKYDVMKTLNSMGGRMQLYNFTQKGLTSWTSKQ